MRQLNEQEVEALQYTIINEGYLPISEKFGSAFYRATWDIDGVKYLMCKLMDELEVFQIEGRQ